MSALMKSSECPRCGEMGKLRTREFSDQALAQLLSWGELDKKHVATPVCDGCYMELREALIESETHAISAKKASPNKQSDVKKVS